MNTTREFIPLKLKEPIKEVSYSLSDGSASQTYTAAVRRQVEIYLNELIFRAEDRNDALNEEVKSLQRSQVNCLVRFILRHDVAVISALKIYRDGFFPS